MKRLLISASLNVNDDCSTDMLSRMLMSLADANARGNSVGIQTVQFKPTEGLERRVWIYQSPFIENPYFLVSEAGDIRISRPLAEAEIKRLFDEGVCIGLRGTYPRPDRFGVPGWASSNRAYTIPSFEGFCVSEEFDSVCEESGDETPESFWYQVALSEESDLLTEFNT